MSIKKRILKYAKENFGGVMHTTLNPDGPGAVRIHLVPPKIEGDEVGASVAIINGQDIVPVNTSWAILLSAFINEVNKYEGRALSDEDVEAVMKATMKTMRKIYPWLSKKLIRQDVYKVMHTFTLIAQGQTPEEDVTYMSMGEYAPFMKAPHRMDLMISSMSVDGCWNCNQKCVHCYAAGQKYSEEPELSTEEWKTIIDRCRQAGIPQVTFTGGEPTMREDLVELVAHAAWFVTRLNTNGVALTPELCQRLHEASLDSMQITFYSCDRAIHNQMVGVERYDDTVAGIKNALEAGLNISINTPLCTANRNYLRTLEFLHELGVTYVTCSGLIITGNATTETSEALQLSKDEIKDILKEAVGYCNDHDMEISFTSPGWVEPEFCEELHITTPSCGACLSNMAITPGGNVVPCQSWLSDRPLGNMINDQWETIWDSPRCKQRRDYSAKMLGLCPFRKGGEADD